MDVDAIIAGILSLIGAGIYLFLGMRLAKRPVSAHARLPAAQFALFWIGLSAVTLMGAILSLLATEVLPSVALVVTFVHLEILILCAALWGLLGHLTYLYTGRNYLVPWSVFYGALYLFLTYIITAATKVVTVSQGTVSLQYSNLVGGPTLAILIVLLIVPEFIGAILYFTLIFRTQDPTIRYRVTLVSWSLIAWFGLASINVAHVLGGGLAANLLSNSLGVIAAIVIVLAYYPPRSIRARLRVTGIDSSSVTP